MSSSSLLRLRTATTSVGSSSVRRTMLELSGTSSGRSTGGRRCLGTTTSSSSAWQRQKHTLAATSTTRWETVDLSSPSSVLSSSVRKFSSYPPHEVVGLPSLSPTMESGSIASWNLAEGDSFNAGDSFCSIETDKATVDFEAQDEGVLAKILEPAGDGAEINCGQPIMVIVEDADDVAAFSDFTAAAAPVAAAPEAPEAAPAAAPVAPPVAAAAPAPPSASTGDRVVASPLAHMLAQELGYDISQISGTGPGGRIIAADVKEFTPSAASSSESPSTAVGTALPPPPIAGEGYTDYPLSEAAREVAARLTQSKRNVPHYYLTVDVSVDDLLVMRQTINESLASKKNNDTSIGVYEMLIKAAALSMKAVPSANASWMDSVVRVFDQVDMNIVVGGGGDGEALATPVIQDAARKGLSSISQELQAAVDGLKTTDDEDGDSPPPTLSGLGTFTMLNLGMYGIKSCTPIIREPQACALALGALETRIVVNTDSNTTEDALPYRESVMFTATLSCDHRVVDGAVGAQWLQTFKSHVENPQTLLL